MTRTTAAIVSAAGAPFVLEEVDLDEPRPSEVLVRLVATGLCHTDLSAQAGHLPFPLPGVLGHEGAGIVETVGASVTRVAPGDHVLASFSSCGECPNCLERPAYCRDFHARNLFGGTRPDGSATIFRGGEPVHGHFFGQSTFARHALIDERSLVKVADDAALETLAPLGCGIQTGAGAVLNALTPRPESTLAVFGAGAVGCAAIMAAALSGVRRIVAVDLVPERLALALELGATHTVEAASTDPIAALRDIGDGGADYVIEATGAATALTTAIQSLAPLGTCAILSTYPRGTTVPLDANFMIDGRHLVGVSEGDSDPQEFLPRLVELFAQGLLPVDKLIRHYPFAEIERAAADARSGATIKPVLVFD